MTKKLSDIGIDKLFSNLKEDSEGKLHWRGKRIRNEGLDLSKWIPIFISILSLVVSFLSNLDKIVGSHKNGENALVRTHEISDAVENGTNTSLSAH